MTNALFLRSLGLDTTVAMGGNWADIPAEIRRNFEGALGEPILAGSAALEGARVDAHLLFDTYTRLAGDDDADDGWAPSASAADEGVD